MTKKLDPDVKVLRAAVKALNGSTSRKMLKANLDFIVDRYITHPFKYLPEHLKEKKGGNKS